ncbi:TD and POZ domain-containing protein 1 [Nephila pilipes]|uniref:TD and POZ domain-containing protein 1 n=1 Tax=Nephila pilipes TaxID=299642 RepID=A0A8X6U6Q4_NEPPI|nr:TD and POZ domain-containing protein 1 [Nephila pilipes]
MFPNSFWGNSKPKGYEHCLYMPTSNGFFIVASSYTQCLSSMQFIPDNSKKTHAQNVDADKRIKNLNRNSQVSRTSLKDDVLAMYSGDVLCDVEVRSATEIFTAHQFILSARSPLFRAMFSREKTRKFVDLENLDAETVQRMLLFLYSDILENLNWQSACRLYFAADRYQIPSLKHECSSFLKQNLLPSNGCDILILADRHKDHELKITAQKYIETNKKEVSKTDQWQKLKINCPQLAIEILRLIRQK